MNPLWDALFAPHAGSDRALLLLPGGETISHAALLDRAARMARVLSRHARPGARVAAQVPKSPDALALYAACIRAGLVFLPLNTAYTGTEIAYFVADSGASVFVSAPRGGPVPDEVHRTAHVLTLGQDGDGSLAAAADTAEPMAEVVQRSEDDLAALLYTSGTTGRSKGAMLSHRNLVSNAVVLAQAWRFSEADVLLHVLPIFHTHGLFVATNIVLLTGGAMILLPRFDVDAVLAHLLRATAMMGVPTFYTRLLDEPRFSGGIARHMRLFTCGSAPLPAQTHRAFAARTGQTILERYGMTETNMSTSNPYEGERRAGTVGLPLPGVDLRIADRRGNPVPQGAVGTIEVRGPNVFQGYWGMPDKTAKEMRPDGFFVTGDLATQSADGYVTIVGRAKDVVISGGLNVYPKEVEEVLDDQPGVRESAVIGVPHPDLGEAVVAILVPAADTEPDLGAVASAASGRLAAFKRPKRLILAPALPRNAMGKVQKADLRATHADLFGA